GRQRQPPNLALLAKISESLLYLGWGRSPPASLVHPPNTIPRGPRHRPWPRPPRTGRSPPRWQFEPRRHKPLVPDTNKRVWRPCKTDQEFSFDSSLLCQLR